MPNRMLRDWTRSDKVVTISVHAERFFVRLIMKADDYGCYYATPALLKADLFPLLLDTIREADILRWTAECQKAELIVLYEFEGKKYLQIVDFRQRLDKAKNKYPLPPSGNPVTIVNDFPAEVEVENRKGSESNTRADLSKSNLFRQPVIPLLEDVQRVFMQQGGTLEMAQKFFEANGATGWYHKGSPITNFANLVPGYVANWKRNDGNSSSSQKRMVV